MRLKQRRHTKKTELVEADEGKSTKEKRKKKFAEEEEKLWLGIIRFTNAERKSGNNEKTKFIVN